MAIIYAVKKDGYVEVAASGEGRYKSENIFCLFGGTVFASDCDYGLFNASMISEACFKKYSSEIANALPPIYIHTLSAFREVMNQYFDYWSERKIITSENINDVWIICASQNNLFEAKGRMFRELESNIAIGSKSEHVYEIAKFENSSETAKIVAIAANKDQEEIKIFKTHLEE